MKFTDAFAAALLFCTNALADDLDLSFNSDAFRASYVHDLASNDLAWDVGAVNNSDKGFVAYGSLYLRGMASDGRNPLEGGVGGRTGWIDGDEGGQTGIPLALGGYLKYTFPRFNRFSIRTDIYYSPEVLSVVDLEKFEDYSIRLSYNLLREADIYIGARYVKAEFDNDTEQTFDSGMNLGISLRF
jgi:hypothetical protein